MPSLRLHICRLMLKHIVASRFKRAKSVPELRRSMDRLSRFQQIPSGVEIQRALVGGCAAEWVRATGSRPDRAILYLHGGAFVMGSPTTCRELAARISLASGSKVLVPDYRLAPEHPFPAAVQDAVSAYRWLLDTGYSNDNLAIGGDSSGGGLALQTLLMLKEEGDALPSAAFFLSPQTDWVRFDGKSYSTRANVDFFYTSHLFSFTASQYVGDNDPEAPLLSPAHVDMAGLPPLCIHVGNDDVLLSDSVRFARRARESGVEVELKIWPALWHVFQASARFVPEARQSINELSKFVVKHMDDCTVGYTT